MKVQPGTLLLLFATLRVWHTGLEQAHHMAKCVKCGRALPAFSFGDVKSTCKWCRQYEAAQRGEEPENNVQEVVPAPWERGGANHGITITHILFGLNGAVFVCMAMLGISVTNPTSQDLLNSGADSGSLVLAGQWWRLFTSMFVHVGILHFALNMWCLWDLGALAEKLYGKWTFLGMYILTGIAGSLASIAWRPVGVSAGASGAIFGIAGALIAGFKLGEFAMPRAMVQASLRSVVAFAGYNLVLGSVSARTDNAAHIGGLVAGFLCGALIAVVAPDENAAIRRFTILTLVALLLTGGAYGVSEYRGYVVHVGRGEKFLAENNIPAAIKELEKAVRQRPDEADTHILLGAAYLQSKQEDRAEVEFMRAFQIDPNNESAGFWAAETFLKKKDFEPAKNIYHNALKRDPENAYAHFGLGRIYGEQKDFQSAIREYETAASLDEELESVYYEIGNCYAKMNRHDEAIAAFEREAKDVGDYPELQLALAASYDAKGMKRLASEARAKAEKLKLEQKTQ